MLPFFSRASKHHYALLNRIESSGRFFARFPTFQIGLIWLLTFSSIVSLSFIAGMRFAGQNEIDSIGLKTVPEVFRYRRIFGERPSTESDQEWLALFPPQGGYFRHPKLAPHRSAFSVFHQLHCLDGIRQGYWFVYDAAIEGRTLVEEELPFMSSPSHIRHCIDLLRQSLMCQPDTTIEIKDEKLGGVRGFGSKRQCKDWAQLVQWTKHWETYLQHAPKYDDKKNESSHIDWSWQ